MVIVEYFKGSERIYTDKATGFVPRIGDKIIDPFTQKPYTVKSEAEFWPSRQYVKLEVE